VVIQTPECVSTIKMGWPLPWAGAGSVGVCRSGVKPFGRRFLVRGVYACSSAGLLCWFQHQCSIADSALCAAAG